MKNKVKETQKINDVKLNFKSFKEINVHNKNICFVLARDILLSYNWCEMTEPIKDHFKKIVDILNEDPNMKENQILKITDIMLHLKGAIKFVVKREKKSDAWLGEWEIYINTEGITEIKENYINLYDEDNKRFNEILEIVKKMCLIFEEIFKKIIIIT